MLYSPDLGDARDNEYRRRWMSRDRRPTDSYHVHFGYGLVTSPRNAFRRRNLKWELPIAAATGLLIATSDDYINSHIQSLSFAQAASRGSNVGLGIELGVAGLMYLVGCSGHRSSYAANTGFTALEAMGAASLMNYAVKVGTNRQYAYHPDTHGEFWEDGRSFPSGHAAASFAFASVIAHRYPHKVGHLANSRLRFLSIATRGPLRAMHTYSRWPRAKSAQSGSARRLRAHDLRPFGFAKAQAVGCVRVWVSTCFMATDSRGAAASAVMLAAAMTAGVTSSAVRVPPAEIPPPAVEALRRMPAASNVEAARTPAAKGPGSVPATKQMEAT
jgi:membrane-associated phospholipid phosphatase